MIGHSGAGASAAAWNEGTPSAQRLIDEVDICARFADSVMSASRDIITDRLPPIEIRRPESVPDNNNGDPHSVRIAVLPVADSGPTSGVRRGGS